MPATYLFDLNGYRYAVLKKEVDSIRPIETVHRLPFSPNLISGLANIDKQRIVIVDLAGLLGLSSPKERYPARIILGVNHNNETGFLIPEEPTEVYIDKEYLQPIPKYLATTTVRECIIYQGRPIPLIDLKALYELIGTKKLSPILPPFTLPGTRSDPAGIDTIRPVAIGKEIFALPGKFVEEVPGKPPRLATFPATPPYIKGLAFVTGNLCTVIDPAERMNLPRKADLGQKLLKIGIGEESFGFLVDGWRDELPADRSTVYALPYLAKSALISSAAICDEEIFPLINLAALLHNSSDLGTVGRSTEEAHRYRSKFSDRFNHSEIEVVEFTLLGETHALPKDEVEDVIPIHSFRILPNLTSLVIGITLHKNELLPVIDPALVFGRYSIITGDWQMILVANGDFRALIITESTFPTRKLPPSIHKKLPLSQPDGPVYGCYPDGNRVRLVINTAALAGHANRSGIKNFLSTYTSWLSETSKDTASLALIEETSQPLEISLSPGDNDTVIPEIGGRSGLDANSKEQENRKTVFSPELKDKIIKQKGRISSETARQSGDTPPPNISPHPSHDEFFTLDQEDRDTFTLNKDSEINSELSKEFLPDKVTEPIKNGGVEIIKTAGAVPVKPLADEPSEIGKTEPTDRTLKKDIFKATATAGKSFRKKEEPPDSTESGQTNAEEKRANHLADNERPEVPTEKTVKRSSQNLEKEIFRTNVFPKEERHGSGELSNKPNAGKTTRKKPPVSVGPKRNPTRKQTEIPAERIASSPALTKKDMWREFENIIAEPPALPPKNRQKTAAEHFETDHYKKKRAPSNFSSRIITSKSNNKGVRNTVFFSLLILLITDAALFLTATTDRGNNFQHDFPEQAPPVADIPATNDQDADRNSLPLESTGINSPLDLPPDKNPATTERETKPASLTIIVPKNVPLKQKSYTVKEGDTLWDISRRFTGTPYNYPAVALSNNIENPDKIFPDQTILLKKEQ